MRSQDRRPLASQSKGFRSQAHSYPLACSGWELSINMTEAVPIGGEFVVTSVKV